MEHLPLSDEVLKCARFVNFDRKNSAEFSQVEFFINKYPDLLPYTSVEEQNKVEEEFLDYQLMDKEEIPESVWKSALVVIKDECNFYRMDTVWAYMSSAKNPDGMYRFKKLTRIARLVLILPHSNAEEERVFSMVTKNKTLV